MDLLREIIFEQNKHILKVQKSSKIYEFIKKYNYVEDQHYYIITIE